MKLKKVLVGLLTMVFVLSSLVGTAFAKGQVNTLPFSFPDDENDLWVKLIGGGEMIDASSANGKVVRRGAKTNYWRRNFVVARRPIE